MDQKKIDRINELARKAKTEGLTAEEEQERAVLLERRGTPLFKEPMEKLRSIKERYQLTWLELRAVIYAL